MSKMVCLTGSNYHIWKDKMKDLLFVKKMHLPVFASNKPQSLNDEEWEFEHLQVCGYIRQWVEDNVRNHIVNETHAKSLWDKLETLYASKTGNNKLFLLKQLMNIRYKEGTPISDHINDFQGVLDQLSGMGVKFDDEIQGLWLLNTLPDSWETLRVSLTNSAPSGVVTMEYTKSGVLNEEMRRRSQASSSSASHSDVLVTEDRGRNKSRGQNDRGKSRSKSKSKYKNITCDYCHKNGHIMKYCYKHKRDMRQQKREGDNENRVAVVANDDLLVSCDANAINLVRDESSWFVDSGATSHVTPKKELFSSYTPDNFGTLKMGNNHEVEVIGIGTVCLESNNGSKLVLNNVKHAPDVRLNLISVGYLDDEGYVNTLGAGQWKLTRGLMVVARGDKLSNLYVFQGSMSRDSVNLVENDTSSELWHRRLSHMSEKGIDSLAKKNLLSGVKQAKLKKCVHCLGGKQKKVSFQSHPPSRKLDLLELVHSDLCGPLRSDLMVVHFTL